MRRELLGELLPTQTGWFADEDIFRMDISDYSPGPRRPTVSRRHAAGAEHLRRARRDVACRGGGRPARSRRTSPALTTRLIDGLDQLGAAVVTPRAGRRGPLVCVRSTDVSALVASLAGENYRLLGARHEPADRTAPYNVEGDIDPMLEALAAARCSRTAAAAEPAHNRHAGRVTSTGSVAVKGMGELPHPQGGGL